MLLKRRVGITAGCSIHVEGWRGRCLRKKRALGAGEREVARLSHVDSGTLE